MRAKEQPFFQVMHSVEPLIWTASAGILKTSKWEKIVAAFLQYSDLKMTWLSPYVVEDAGTDS